MQQAAVLAPVPAATYKRPIHHPLQQIYDQRIMHGKVAGTFTFKPLQCKFTRDADISEKTNPYCKVRLGWHSGKSSVAKDQGAQPKWSDAIVLNKKHEEQFATLKINDKHLIGIDERLGKAKINLDEVIAEGKVLKWFTLHKGDKIIGEILVGVEFHGRVGAL